MTEETKLPKISKEDLDYLKRIQRENATMSEQLATLEIAKMTTVDHIKELKRKEAEFMTQIYEKYDLPQNENIQVDYETGEVNIKKK